MPTYHIHITGIVQGVGFRPLVCKLAKSYNLSGWVCNDNDGVHVEFNALNQDEANAFYLTIIRQPPKNAFIYKHSIKEVATQKAEDFKIIKTKSAVQPDILLTPDIAICEHCKADIEDSDNRRYQYAFTTCLQCGPRYSITASLPYDRENTTMSQLIMCSYCNEEYNDIYNRRHYSQTNSCPNCAIPIHLYNEDRKEISSIQEEIINLSTQFLSDGKILAVKGIGGYLLMCDATNKDAIRLLRKRKQRPSKPFAVMYDSVEDARHQVVIRDIEEEALLSKEAPIVLCELKEGSAEPKASAIATDLITDGLDKLGVFLPYSPLLKLITSKFKKPLVATSGNLSGSPIIYKDDQALQWLMAFADYIISFEREIVAPQDDSVLQFTETRKKIMLRRSRGFSPNYFPNPFKDARPALAMGAEMKSAFALRDNNNLYISQFLGDQESFESNESFKATLQHLQGLIRIKPQHIIIDRHPTYNVSVLGREMAVANQIPLSEVQHHLAHFAAVLGDNDLLDSREKILGIIWDGTGFGDDGQIWGGEFFLFENKTFKRINHLQYFPHLLGDKMSREPRISALALCSQNPGLEELVRNHFEENEWDFFAKTLAKKPSLFTSSMGRFLDGIASILAIKQENSYEGEAAMKLEAAARNCPQKHFEYYDVMLKDSEAQVSGIIEGMLRDKEKQLDTNYIARKVFISLVKMIEKIAGKNAVNKIAFSGGVFQNALLADLIEEMCGENYTLIWHTQLSPNDECISFGQLAYLKMNSEN